MTSKKKYDTQTRVTAIEISEKDQQKLDVAKRVSSSLLQEIETSHGQILKYYKDGEFVYKKVKALILLMEVNCKRQKTYNEII